MWGRSSSSSGMRVSGMTGNQREAEDGTITLKIRRVQAIVGLDQGDRVVILLPCFQTPSGLWRGLGRVLTFLVPAFFRIFK
ncbi:hypothetical protein CCP2SC5_260016 [Azospirillaceae bacterium]